MANPSCCDNLTEIVRLCEAMCFANEIRVDEYFYNTPCPASVVTNKLMEKIR